MNSDKLAALVLKDIPAGNIPTITSRGVFPLSRMVDSIAESGDGAFVEIGTNLGNSARFIAGVLNKLGKNTTLHTFDPNPPDIKVDGVEFHNGLSPIDTVRFLSTSQPLAFLFIDGCHRPASTMADYCSHLEYMTKDTIVVLDDVRVGDRQWGSWATVEYITKTQGRATLEAYPSDHRLNNECAWCRIDNPV